MKAIIVKDNDFKTIGFEVTASGKTLFTWGISPIMKCNFQKEIDVEKWIQDIFKVVELKSMLNEQENFQRRFFDVAAMNDLVKNGQGVDLSASKISIDATKQSIKNIIENII